MKVIVNYPVLDDDKAELENRVAAFHATLLVEKLKYLNVNDSTKKELLNSIITDLKSKMYE